MSKPLPGGLIAEVRARLVVQANPANAEAMQRYMKSTMPYYGLKSDALRAAVRPLLQALPITDRGEWTASVRELWDAATHREERYAALTLAGLPKFRKFRDAEALELWRHLITTGAWWDLVDNTANLVGESLLADSADVRPVVWGWASESDLWLRRVSIISQLKAKDRTDLELLTHAITTNLEGSEFGSVFWIRKAIGWALRQHARTDADWVRAFVAEHEPRLSGLSRREALKHL